MQRVTLLEDTTRPLRILALGAHADDIEIGCGGTLLRLAAELRALDVRWMVFCSTPERAREAEASARAFLSGVPTTRIIVRNFRDGRMQSDADAVKDECEALRHDFEPDVIFTHYRDDRHQDHRLVSDITWQTWRHHLILEYEIPKYDGDLGAPNFFAPLASAIVERKIALLLEHFPSQASHHWFTAELFRSLPRLRGMECAAPEGWAEAFHCRKLSW